MWDVLRDPMWQFVIGAILAGMAIIITIIIYFVQRRRKAMSYEIVSKTPLLSMEEEVKGKLKILFEDEPVQKVYLIVVKIINSGNVPIVSADYERSISLNFGKKTQILTAEVTEIYPDNLEVSAGIEGKKVVLEPTLLNPKDSITLKMLASNWSGPPTIDARIVGVKKITEFDPGRTAWRRSLFGLGISLVGMIGLLLSGWGDYGFPALPFWFFFVISILGIATMYYFLLPHVLQRISVRR